MKDDSALIRQWRLLKLLGTRHYGATVKELAEEMSVNEKTIRRDLQTFEQVGFPLEEVVGQRGRKSWKVRGSKDQPELNFALDEALALYLGRRFLEPLAGTFFWEAAQSAFKKIRACLGKTALEYLEQIAGRLHHRVVGAGDYSKKADLIDALMQAIEDHKQTFITYRSQQATEPVSYPVYPYGLTYFRGSLYLIAHAPDHDQIRHYKVDRIEEAELTELPFNRPGDFDLEKHLAGSFGVFQGGEGVTVKIRFAPPVARYVEEVRKFLRENCGLELSAEKTRITHVREGYDFLGFNISAGVGKSGEVVPKVKVGRKAINNIRRRLDEALRCRPMQESISVRLANGSAVIRGWANYFKIAHNFSQVANGLDHKALWIALKAICRKSDISTAQCFRRYYFHPAVGIHKECTLARFRDTEPAHYFSAPKPYQPGGHQSYVEDGTWEAAFVLPDQSRPGRGDLKWKALIRDGFHCRSCAAFVSAKTSHADHIRPVNSFANLAMANDLDNIQTLCLRCHHLKTTRDS